MMKKLTALLLVSLLLLLTGCQKNTENLRGDVNSRNALRICVDIGYRSNQETVQYMEDFMISLRQTGGLTDIVYEVLPNAVRNEAQPSHAFVQRSWPVPDPTFSL